MINNIDNLKTGLAEVLPDSFNKETLLENFRSTLKSLKVNLGLATELMDIVGKDKLIKYTYLSTIATYNNIKADTVSPIISYLIGVLNILDDNAREVEKLILDISDINLRSNINFRSAMLYKIVSDYYFLNRFILDLFNYTIDTYSNDKREELKDYNYRTLEEVELTFIQLAKFYSEDAKFAKEFEKTYPDILIDLGSKDSDSFLDTIIKKIKGKGVVNSLSSGFKYNPIYIIGKMFIDSDLRKAQSLKDKQEMLKFKIIEAQSLNAEGKIDNEKMAKAIASYQKEIDKAEYEIIRILKA